MPKKNRVPKSGPVWRRSAEQATLDRMPKYNAHACGIGPHGDAKYNRAKEKQAWKRELDRQGTRRSGSLLLFVRSRSGHAMTLTACMFSRGAQYCPPMHDHTRKLELNDADLMGFSPDELSCNQCGGAFCGLRVGRVLNGKPLIMCSRKDEVKAVLASLGRR